MAEVHICLRPAEGCGITKQLGRIVTECTDLNKVTAECHRKLHASADSSQVLVGASELPLEEWLEAVIKFRSGEISKVPGVMDVAEDKTTVTVTVTGTPLLQTHVLEGGVPPAYSSPEEDHPIGKPKPRAAQLPWQQEGSRQVLARYPRTSNGQQLLGTC